VPTVFSRTLQLHCNSCYCHKTLSVYRLKRECIVTKRLKLGSCSFYLLSQIRLSSVCNVRAPYSAGWHFRQCFNVILYQPPADLHAKFYGDRPRGTLPSGLNARWVAKRCWTCWRLYVRNGAIEIRLRIQLMTNNQIIPVNSNGTTLDHH